MLVNDRVKNEREKKSVEMNCEPVDPDPLHLSEIKKEENIFVKIKIWFSSRKPQKKFNVGIFKLKFFLLR